MTLKARYTIFNLFMALGGVCAAVDIVYDFATGIRNQNLPIMIGLAFVFFIAGIIFRFTVVKCPHCGDKLLGQKGVPAKCPVCGTASDKKPA